MSMKDTLTSLVVGLALERPAKRQSPSELVDDLEVSGRELDGRLQSLRESPTNVKQLRHIIGIERWGQRRLRVALGEPPLLDEYDEYQPAADLNWDDLRGAFRTTRAETIALARTLAAHDPASLTKVSHNQAGPLSIPAWIHYLTNHANRESMRLK
jgi:hypothetical protein